MGAKYMITLLEESARTAYKIDEAIQRRVDEGWSIHTWTVLRHEFVSDGSNHGHGGRFEIVASVLWVRDSRPPKPPSSAANPVVSGRDDPAIAG